MNIRMECMFCHESEDDRGVIPHTRWCRFANSGWFVALVLTASMVLYFGLLFVAMSA